MQHERYIVNEEELTLLDKYQGIMSQKKTSIDMTLLIRKLL